MLNFILGLFLFIGFIALLVGSPAFRKAALVVAILIGIGIYALVREDNRRSQEYAQRQQVAAAQSASRWTRVSPSELFVKTADLNTDGYRRGYREFKIDVKNLSAMAVTDIRVSVQLFDCPKDAALDSCDQIGEAAETLRGEIPPSQARELKASYEFKNEPPVKGQLRWTYHIEAVRSQ